MRRHQGGREISRPNHEHSHPVEEPDGARLHNNEFAAALYPAFLREVGAGSADGRIRYREDFVAGLERAPEAFIGVLEGRNFGKLIVRVDV